MWSDKKEQNDKLYRERVIKADRNNEYGDGQAAKMILTSTKEREKEHPTRGLVAMEIPRKRRGRLEIRWKDALERDMCCVGYKAEDAMDRVVGNRDRPLGNRR